MRIIHRSNLFDINSGTIGHQVNCCGVMGAGLALQIKGKFPKVFKEYERLCYINDPEELLGMIQPVKVNGNLEILNLFGQATYGHGQQTNYEALRIIADKLSSRNMIVNLPYKMGCGLGGGDWEIVQNIFRGVSGYWHKL